MSLTAIKLEEAGYASAMKGLSLNKSQDSHGMNSVAIHLSDLDYGHNKFMEHIMLWTLVRAPRYWWQDADTYRMSSKQSESTNHTILRRELRTDDFEDNEITCGTLDHLNYLIEKKDFLHLKKYMPEGFMQEREWMFSYKTFRNIIMQRTAHKLPHWQQFIHAIWIDCDHKEFLPDCTNILKIKEGNEKAL